MDLSMLSKHPELYAAIIDNGCATVLSLKCQMLIFPKTTITFTSNI